VTKYEQQQGEKNFIDVSPTCMDDIGDPSVELWLTEGQKKADALASHGLCAIALLGVWNWRGKNVFAGKVALADWEDIALNGRVVNIVFDSDIYINKDIRKAAGRLKRFLEARGAKKVYAILLPTGTDDEKVGVDDFFAAGGTVEELYKRCRFAQFPAVHDAPTVAELAEAHNGINATDLGNSRRIVKHYGNDLRYVTTWKKWYVWNGKVWQEDTTDHVLRVARNVVKLIYREATDVTGAKRTELSNWAKRSESRDRLRAMVQLAESEQGVATRFEELNSDPWLLNVENGTLNLKTGELQEHDRANLITHHVPVAYDADAKAPTWDDFLDEIMDGDEEMISFLQRAVGYSLTGVVREHVLFFLHGDGNNGKSTFTGAIQKLLGTLSFKAPKSLVQSQYGSSVPNDVAKLPGKRFVFASELSKDLKLDEAKIKDLTGGDRISARFMRAEWFEFDPTHKLWMFGNNKPQVTGQDYGIWRRIKLIPFLVKIPEEEVDTEMPDKLEAELPGILTWAVQGCMDWQKRGLDVPDAVVAATMAYKEEQSPIASFIAEECFVNPGTQVTWKALKTAYVQWCAANDATPLLPGQLRKEFDRRGFKSAKGSGNVTIRLGIGLLTT
jgi:putative DNA primase/helicase